MSFPERMKQLQDEIENALWVEELRLFIQKVEVEQGDTDFEILGLSGQDKVERLEKEAVEKYVQSLVINL